MRDAGISEIAFYNYGHLREENLRWIGEATGRVDGRDGGGELTEETEGMELSDRKNGATELTEETVGYQ